MAANASYTEGQLNRFRRLIRVAARYLFSGDLSERLQEMEAQNADADPAAAGPSKFRRKRMRENDLGIVLLDALTYHEGWISEERFAEKLSLGGKQVRKMLHLLQRQGFVACEHRREKKQGDKVQSVAEYEEAAPQARTATYISLDYPLAYDALRLRLYLAKKAAADAIDDGNAVEQYACCSRDGVEPVCGQSYDSVGLAFLDRDSTGLYYKCSTCDFGIVAPDDALSRQEPNGVLRIKRAKFRRDAATKQKEALLRALKPLDDMVAELAQVDPPDFGSFTDWLQRRQDLMKSGQAHATEGGGGSRKGRLDYGIDGPLMGNGEVDLTIDGDDGGGGAGPSGHAIMPEPEAPAALAAANLPHFLQQAPDGGMLGAAPAHGAVATTKAEDTSQEKAEEDEAQRARYQAYIQQFHAQLAQAMGMNPEDEENVKSEAAADLPAAEQLDAAGDPAAKRQRTGEEAGAGPDQAVHADGVQAGVDDIEWEEDKPGSTALAADAIGPSGAQSINSGDGNGDDDDDLDWEEA